MNEAAIHFSERDDVSCLCTFPHNYEGGQLDGETIRSLAYLGAAVVLVQREVLDEDYVFLPDMLPEWIVNEIKRLVPNEQA